ncbi:MAG TPA: hypothetical protein GXX19_01430 [Syntrophomonadaceae bacterium]|nr:hypothetical protein [Syntrophomonadaceae bacterium]
MVIWLKNQSMLWFFIFPGMYAPQAAFRRTLARYIGPFIKAAQGIPDHLRSKRKISLPWLDSPFGGLVLPAQGRINLDIFS